MITTQKQNSCYLAFLGTVALYDVFNQKAHFLVDIFVITRS